MPLSAQHGVANDVALECMAASGIDSIVFIGVTADRSTRMDSKQTLKATQESLKAKNGIFFSGRCQPNRAGLVIKYMTECRANQQHQKVTPVKA